MRKRWTRLLCALLALALPALAAAETAAEGNPVVVIRVAGYGDIYAELYPDTAPVTVANFLSLVDSGFYNGLTFHRIISGFMMQGGDPLGNGTGGSEKTIRGEFTENGFENPLLHERGVLSMARSSQPDSASSQFFIMHADYPSLDGKYAAFGRVLAGMDVVDAVCENAVTGDRNGTVAPKDQPVMTEVARATREEAGAAAEREARNGAAGETYTDLASGLTFPVPDGWALARDEAGVVFRRADGEGAFSVSTMNFWLRQGAAAREQLEANGLTRDQLNTAAIRPSAFAGWLGVAEEQLTQTEVNGAVWYTASRETDEGVRLYWAGALNGSVIVLAAQEGPGAEAVRSVLGTLDVQ